MKWDYTLSKISVEVAQELGLQQHAVKTAYEVFMRLFGRALRNRRKGVIEHFGVWRLSPQKTYKRLAHFIRQYHYGKIERPLLEGLIRKYWPDHEAARYHWRRKGKYYKQWSKLRNIYGRDIRPPKELIEKYGVVKDGKGEQTRAAQTVQAVETKQ